MKIENENVNWCGFDGAQVRREEGAGHAAQRGADAVGEQLRAHDRDARARRRALVVAQRDPRPAHPRVAQPEVDEQHQRDEREREPVPRAQVERPEARRANGRSIRSIAGDARSARR